MGTNYYQIIDPCPHCKRGIEKRHIGKSSAGWPFLVHVIPNEGILRWPDWVAALDGAIINDEYGSEISLDDLNQLVISQRKNRDKDHVLECYRKYPGHAEQDPLTGDQLTPGEFS